MAITYRASNTQTQTTSTTLTLTKPTGTASGDVILALISGNASSGHPLVTPPSGWIQLDNTVNVSTFSSYSYYKIAGPSEPANYAWIFDRPMVFSTGGIASYQGGANTIDGHSGQKNTAATTCQAASITTTLANDLLVFMGDVTIISGTANWTVPSGFTQRINISGSSTVIGMEFSDEAFASPGPTGVISASLSSSQASSGFLVALGAASTVVLQDFPLFFGAQ